MRKDLMVSCRDSNKSLEPPEIAHRLLYEGGAHGSREDMEACGWGVTSRIRVKPISVRRHIGSHHWG